MTELQLKEIENRLNKASPSPWRHIPGDNWCAYSMVVTGNRTFILEDHSSPDDCKEDKHGDCDKGGFPTGDDDGEFIAHAPEDITNLLAEVRRLREEIGGLNMVLKECEQDRFEYGEENLKLRAALENIARPTYGTELCNSDQENNEIIARHFFDHQRIARNALSVDEGDPK